MKATYSFKLLLGLCSLLILFSCTDDLTSIGGSTQPPSDFIEVKGDTFLVKAETITLDSVLINTEFGFLGEFTDPLYGKMKADYLLQFYCPRGFKFVDSMDVSSGITNIELQLQYKNYFGDSLTTFEASVYELTELLSTSEAKDYYADLIDPDYFTNKKETLLGKKVYTAYDFSVPDSVRKLSTYIPKLKIPFNPTQRQKWAEKFLKADKTVFSSQDNFNEFFKGVFLTTNYGDGTILYAAYTDLILHYKYKKNGQLRDTTAIFPATKDIKQSNRFKYPDLKDLTAMYGDSISHLRAPAGIATQITIPIKEMLAKTKWDNHILNVASFQIEVLPPEKGTYNIPLPSKVMLIERSQRISFFEYYQLDLIDKNAFIGQLTLSEDTTAAQKERYYYEFSSVARLVQRYLQVGSKLPYNAQDLVMVMLPVSTTGNESSGTYTSVENALIPSAARIRNHNHPTRPLKITIKYSDF